MADKKALNTHKIKLKKRTLTAEVENNILFYLIKDYSPKQIVGRPKIDMITMVTKERFCQYIWENKRKGGLLFKHLRTKAKKYKKRGHLKDKRGLIVGRVDISERPSIVDRKSKLVNLEIDLVIGKNHKGALLTINDRVSGILFIDTVESKEVSVIQQKTIEILQ